MKKNLAGMIVATAIIMISTQAQAALLVDWFFLNSGGTFGPGDVVIQQGRLANLAQSDTNFTFLNFISASSSGVPEPAGTYGGEFGSPGTNDFWGQFSGINLAPGESLDFIHSSYTPAGPTASGAYFTQNSIEFGSGASPASITRYFEWTTEGGGGQPNNVIPEPATVLLFGSGLAAAYFRRKQRV